MKDLGEWTSAPRQRHVESERRRLAWKLALLWAQKEIDSGACDM